MVGAQRDDEVRLFNGLREANQKRLKNAPIIMKQKNNQVKIVKGQKMWACPMCKINSKRLTVAHVGTKAADIIRKVMRENRTKDFLKLDDKVMEAHENVMLVVACDKCNRKVES